MWLQGSYLVNTARGAIVDRDSLVKVMKDGHLAGMEFLNALCPRLARSGTIQLYPIFCLLQDACTVCLLTASAKLNIPRHCPVTNDTKLFMQGMLEMVRHRP